MDLAEPSTIVVAGELAGRVTSPTPQRGRLPPRATAVDGRSRSTWLGVVDQILDLQYHGSISRAWGVRANSPELRAVRGGL